jgi:hypothetical protein
VTELNRYQQVWRGLERLGQVLMRVWRGVDRCGGAWRGVKGLGQV